MRNFVTGIALLALIMPLPFIFFAHIFGFVPAFEEFSKLNAESSTIKVYLILAVVETFGLIGLYTWNRS